MERFKELIKESKQQHMIDLLRSMSKEEKKKLVPLVKELCSEYHQFGHFSGRYGYAKGTKQQRTMLAIAAFVCYDLDTFEKTRFIDDFVCHQSFLEQVIDWYCPGWFNTYVNELAARGQAELLMSYEWMMELTARGLLNPSPALIALILPASIIQKNNSSLRPEILLRWKETLQEHIWLLFEIPSGIHHELQVGKNNTITKTAGWLNIFKQLSKDNSIDRHRLLQETLLTSNRNFNKIQAGWFAQLFLELQPQQDELMALQPELFHAMSSRHSKPVTVALNALKEIVTGEGFDIASFLQVTPVLLSSKTKTIVTTSLSLLENLAAQYPNQRNNICMAVCQTFLQTDAAIQTRAGKLIASYGSADNKALQQAITNMQPAIRESVRTILEKWNTEEAGTASSTAQALAIHNEPACRQPLIPLSFPESIDDLIFLASQAFDNNDPSHIDLLPAAILRFQNDLTAADVQKFFPAFQYALKLASTYIRSNQGTLDHMLARFFIDFGHWLMKRFPDSCQPLKKLYQKHNIKGKFAIDWTKIPKDSSFTGATKTRDGLNFISIYKISLLAALKKLQTADQLPLLSTPVFQQGWIDPGTLINRMQAYQQKKTDFDEMDLQIAISRCMTDCSNSILENISGKLTGESRALMLFLIDDKENKPQPVKLKTSWIIASMVKRKREYYKEFEDFPYYKDLFAFYAGKPAWQFSSTYTYQFSNDLGKTYKQASKEAGCVQLNIWANEKDHLKRIEGAEHGLLYNFLPVNKPQTYLEPVSNDIERVLSLMPSNPDPFIASLIQNTFHISNTFEAPEKKIISAILRTLDQTWKEPRPVPMLFLATALSLGDKTISNMAGGIWLKKVENGTMDSALLGNLLGKMQLVKYGPLQRLIDVIEKQLLDVSALHNKELLIMVTAIVSIIEGTEIRNLQKLLVLHRELIMIAEKSK